jgi:hypothetical protein
MILVAVLTVVNVVSSSSAVTAPFTEEFSADAADWHDVGGIADLSWVMNGGPDGGSYASTTFNFVGSTDIDTPPLFRAHAAYGSSGSSNGAFVGDWTTHGPVHVGGVSAFVRHDTGTPLIFFLRFAGPANFPGAVSIIPAPVPSGVWTPISVTIPDPAAVYEGPFTFGDVFGNIGNVQIGVLVPGSLAGQDQEFTFDIDKVSLAALAPAASSGGVVVMGLSVLLVGSFFVRARRRLIA